MLDDLRVDLKVTVLADVDWMLLVRRSAGAARRARHRPRGAHALHGRRLQRQPRDHRLHRLQDVANKYLDYGMGINVITANKKVAWACWRPRRACAVQEQRAVAVRDDGAWLGPARPLDDQGQAERRHDHGRGRLRTPVPAQRRGRRRAALGRARAGGRRGFREPDPATTRFLDVERKTVGRARAGLKTELSDIEGECLLPAALKGWSPARPTARLVAAQRSRRQAVRRRLLRASRRRRARARCWCRSGGSTKTARRQSRETVDKGTALSRCQGNDNIIAIYSKRYSSQPLVIQGPGAGAEITASGLFADLLSLARSCVEWTQTGC